jgi:hypothetical protein
MPLHAQGKCISLEWLENRADAGKSLHRKRPGLTDEKDKGPILDYSKPRRLDLSYVKIFVGVAVFTGIVVGLLALLTDVTKQPDGLMMLAAIAFWTMLGSATIAAGPRYGMQDKDFWA